MVLLNINEDNSIQITIKVKPANAFFKVSLLFFAIFPIAIMLITLVISKIESPFGFFIGFLLFSLCSLYLFRLFLWNSYGREVYSIKGNTITSYNDYGLLKDNRQTRDFLNLKFCYATKTESHNLIDLDEKTSFPKTTEVLYFIVFIIDDEAVSSAIPLPYHNIKILAGAADRINRKP